MADEFAGGSPVSASDDIAATVERAFADAGADPSPAHPAPETAEPPSPAIPGAATGSDDAPVGPIPLDRHREILENARKKARDEAEQEYRQKYGWADSYESQQVAQMKQVWDWMQTNPHQFLETFQRMIPPAETPAVPQGPPAPDYKTEDGITFYSSQQAAQLVDFKLQEFRRQLEQEYGPIRQRVIENDTKERARSEASVQVAQARQTWPMFTDLEPDMKALMAQNGSLSLHDAYIGALRERGLKMHEEKIRSEYGAQLQRKADASTPAPRSAPSTPTNRAQMDTRELVALEFERAAKSR